MQTAGQLLQKTRLEKGITLEQVASQTKIRKQFLINLEADDFASLPSSTSAKGFLKSYAAFLGLSVDKVLAVFRRDFDKKEGKKIVPQGLVKPIDDRSLFWSPKFNLIALISLAFLGLIAYLIFQYFSLIKPPILRISYPTDGITVNQEIIKITGQTDADALLVINGDSVLLKDNGTFEHQLVLFKGENQITIEATSKNGKKTQEQLKVFLD